MNAEFDSIVEVLNKINNTLHNNNDWIINSITTIAGIFVGFLLSEIKESHGKTILKVIETNIADRGIAEIYDPIKGPTIVTTILDADYVTIVLSIEIYNSVQKNKMIEILGLEYKVNNKVNNSILYKKGDNQETTHSSIKILSIAPYKCENYLFMSVLDVKEVRNPENIPIVYLKYRIGNGRKRKIRLNIKNFT